MKKFVIGLVLAISLMALSVMGMGMPEVHEVDGSTFGMMVSDAATSEPGMIAMHVSENAGGMPVAHEMDGKTFGDLVSDMASSAPGAVAGHIN